MALNPQIGDVVELVVGAVSSPSAGLYIVRAISGGNYTVSRPEESHHQVIVTLAQIKTVYPASGNAINFDGQVNFTAGPVIIGADPGGAQILRVGGTGHFSGLLTLDAGATIVAGGLTVSAGGATINGNTSLLGTVNLNSNALTGVQTLSVNATSTFGQVVTITTGGLIVSAGGASINGPVAFNGAGNGSPMVLSGGGNTLFSINGTPNYVGLQVALAGFNPLGNGVALQYIAASGGVVATSTFTGLTLTGVIADLSGVTKTGTGAILTTYAGYFAASTLGTTNYGVYIASGGLAVAAGGVVAATGVGAAAALSAGNANLGMNNGRVVFYDDTGNASYVSYDAAAITYFRATNDTIWQSVPSGLTRFSAAGTQLMRLAGNGLLTVAGGVTVSAGGLTVSAGLTNIAGGLTVSGGNLSITNNVGFYNTAPVAKQTVTGSKGANAALTSLMAALGAMGLVTDSTT